jgi:hypothetical protein
MYPETFPVETPLPPRCSPSVNFCMPLASIERMQPKQSFSSYTVLRFTAQKYFLFKFNAFPPQKNGTFFYLKDPFLKGKFYKISFLKESNTRCFVPIPTLHTAIMQLKQRFVEILWEYETKIS